MANESSDGSAPEAIVDNGARLGLAIAKKRARRAVDRNRIKRQVRESFRLQRNTLGSLDIVVMNRDSAANAEKTELRRKLDELWQQIAAYSEKVNG